MYIFSQSYRQGGSYAFSELKNIFFSLIFLLKTSQEGHFLLIFHVNEVAPILLTHFDAT